MPTYNFRHIDTGEVIERRMKIVEKEEFLLENPEYVSIILGAPTIGDPVRMGLLKPDNGFRDVLRKLKKDHPLGHFNTHD